VKLAYIVKRFPKFSETFVLHELLELRRQGDEVVICSLQRPHPGEPCHEGAVSLAAQTVYLPSGLRRVSALTAASLRTLVASPRPAGGALAWSLGWTIRQRQIAHLRRFGEAAYLRFHLPPDLDHLHAHFAHGPASVALLLSRLTGRPFSFTGHAKDLFQLVRPQLLRAKVREARFVVAVSEYTRRYIVRAVDSRDSDKVVVVRNGIDRRRFSRRARNPKGEPLVLAVSRLVEKKGLDTLVDACALLLRALGRDLRCEVIGEGPLRGSLTERIGRLGLGGRVMLDGGRDQAAVRDAYERASVFVLPCRRDSAGDQDALPVSLVEALAVGVPVVTTPVSGIPEVVRDGDSGLLVPPGDAERLAHAIENLLRDEALRGRLAAAGPRSVTEYDLATSVARLRRLFRDGPEL
jgi:glycosyltransferase involved in cell wall biosynthesis